LAREIGPPLKAFQLHVTLVFGKRFCEVVCHLAQARQTERVLADACEHFRRRGRERSDAVENQAPAMPHQLPR
jgi:hypothetical protein